MTTAMQAHTIAKARVLCGFAGLLFLFAFIWLMIVADLAYAAVSEDGGFATETRVILALNDDSENRPYWFEKAHKLAEMPLNHLGMVVRHHNLSQPLPSLAEMADVRGILLWLSRDRMADPVAFLQWSITMMRAGKRFVIMGTPPFLANLGGKLTPEPLLLDFWRTLGLRPLFEWVRFTHKVELVGKNPIMLGFERSFSGVLPSYHKLKLDDSRLTVHLTARQFNKPDTDSVLIATGPKGGYVAEAYALYISADGDFIQWYINPFEFFAKAFATDQLPKPDATTISNRRIYFSHIDGDGWRNLTQIDGYRQDKKLSSEVVLKEILLKYPDLPVTVAPIAGDLDERLGLDPAIIKVAKAAFALQHVEIGSHTYSHPLFWQFFTDYTEESEQRYLWLYPQLQENDFVQQLLSLLDMGRKKKKIQMDTGVWKRELKKATQKKGENGREEKVKDFVMEYRTPRAYHFGPFSIEEEVAGSIGFIEKFAPAGKKVALYQWSGDTLPFERAIAAVSAAGVSNINGGDSRFDRQFPSISWVAPLGRRVGKAWQTYSSNSNENTYTELWTSNFFGFKHLTKTVHNTGTPRRLKPFNLYYHMYSGEKISSLNALRFNLDYARSLAITPITTSHFTRIVEGAIAAKLQRDGRGRWRILERGALNTVRFDGAIFKQVDFAASVGVIGQLHHQGSLYVALDGDHPDPIIALTAHKESGKIPKAGSNPYLLESRWLVRALSFPGEKSIKFKTAGFGKGEFSWQTTWSGGFKAILYDANGNELERQTGLVGEGGGVKFVFAAKGLPGGRVEISSLVSN